MTGIPVRQAKRPTIEWLFKIYRYKIICYVGFGRTSVLFFPQSLSVDPSKKKFYSFFFCISPIDLNIPSICICICCHSHFFLSLYAAASAYSSIYLYTFCVWLTAWMLIAMFPRNNSISLLSRKKQQAIMECILYACFAQTNRNVFSSRSLSLSIFPYLSLSFFLSLSPLLVLLLVSREKQSEERNAKQRTALCRSNASRKNGTTYTETKQPLV